jgi:AcrR family transcriptional regulator
MAKRTETGTTQRKPLNRERVLQAAVRLADDRGLEELSMRKLAQELGVEAMSLYNHVENKDDILDGIVDFVAREIELPAAEADWKSAIRRNTISARDVYVRHKWASNLAIGRQAGGPARTQHSDWLLRTLREAGFADDVIYHAYHVLEAYVLGYTTLQLSFPYTGEEIKGMAAKYLEEFDAEAFPDVAEHIRQHMEPHEDETGGFEFGLDLILDGLERLRNGGTASA